MKNGIKVSTSQGELLIARFASEDEAKRVCRELEQSYPGVNFYCKEASENEAVVESEYFPSLEITLPVSGAPRDGFVVPVDNVPVEKGAPKKKATAKAKKK